MTIRVNFGKPMPVFPLHTATLLPHGFIQLHVFEPRYRQMVSDVLDQSGQIAMAVFAGEKWKEDYHGRPPLKPAVCIGQILQHARNEDETYDIVLQGVCRARIIDELPADSDRLYRLARLEPLGSPVVEESVLSPHREKLADMLSTAPLTDLKNADGFVEYLRGEKVPASVIIELLAYTFLPMEDSKGRYAYLAESNPVGRARMVENALGGIAQLLKRAEPQRNAVVGGEPAPKGCSWN